MSMFCYQCEQTSKGSACTLTGVCGKDPEVAALQDLLIYACKDISRYAHRAYQAGRRRDEIDHFTIQAIFATLTNTNFDAGAIQQFLREAVKVKAVARQLAAEATGRDEEFDCPVRWEAAVEDRDELIGLGKSVSIESRLGLLGDDLTGLQELITYGIKGLSAYAVHAQKLGQQDPEIYAFIHRAFDYLTRKPESAEALLNLAMECGRINLRTMELLDAANTGAYGHPEPTRVRVTPVKGKCIVVSGHDLKDLEELLKQTEGKGLNVYTHGEMLPANAYPGLKKYKHLVGNYGGAWQDQQKEFERFPGAILMTTNCLQKPRESYRERIFTSGVVGWEGVRHIAGHNFEPVIEAALAQPGFPEDAEEKYIMTGFAHNAVMKVADQLIEAIKAGQIRHIFLIGGCDGAKPGRNYYTEFAEKVPQDCLILTLACGKYRFNKLEFGNIGGIPRLLDVGQCNDSYSAIQIALALSKAFGCSVNDLPLSFVLSWFEQKAVAVLLTLLYLGVEKIKLGPSLPAFISPAVLNVLADKFKIGPITNAEADLAEALGK